MNDLAHNGPEGILSVECVTDAVHETTPHFQEHLIDVSQWSMGRNGVWYN